MNEEWEEDINTAVLARNLPYVKRRITGLLAEQKQESKSELLQQILKEIPDNMINGYVAPGLNTITFKQHLKEKFK